MDHYGQKLGIKSWAEEDRPREKLILHGKGTLSNSELLAILIASGNRDESAVALAQRILAAYNQNLHELGKSNISELKKFKGIGEAKAITITAALELGKRRKIETPEKKIQIRSSRDSYELLRDQMDDLRIEIFKVILLNQKNRVLDIKEVSKGGIAGTVVDIRIIFKMALDKEATSIIVSHNHPSGNLKPSHQDISITKSLVEAGKILNIRVLDHLIIGATGYFSFADESLI